jgi:hypothetical protein
MGYHYRRSFLPGTSINSFIHPWKGGLLVHTFIPQEFTRFCVLERDHPSIADVIIFHSFMKRESRSTQSVNEALSRSLAWLCFGKRSSINIWCPDILFIHEKLAC